LGRPDRQRADKARPRRVREPGFEEAYQAALSLARTPTTKSIAASKGTLRWAWLLYQQSGAWTSLSQATRNQRENIMAHVLEAAGSEPLGRITDTAIQDGLDRRKATPSRQATS
jgi:hypothetical protein